MHDETASVSARLSRAMSDLSEATRTDLDQLDWYRRCLEDVQDGRVVRGLYEAKVGAHRAMIRLQARFAKEAER